MVMTALQNRTAGGGMPPGMAPQQQSNPMQGGGLGDQYSQQVAELKGADPGGLTRQLKAVKQIIAIMLVQNLERLPNVSGKLSKLIPQIDAVLKEVQQASNVNAAVRNPNPIQMSAAQPPEPGGGF